MKKLTLTFIATLMFAVPIALSPAHAQTFKVLHSFDGDNLSVPFGPEGSVIRDAVGNLYGTTFNSPVVYKITPRGRFSILAPLNFTSGSGGAFPTGSLAMDSAGNLYGVGEGGSGTIFKVTPRGKGTELFAFQGGDNTNPKLPVGGLLLGNNGDILGAAEIGNSPACELGCGSIFRLHADGTMDFLHEFTGGTDGSNPAGPLVRDAAGNLYGVAKSGGDDLCAQFFFFRRKGCGVVFKIDTNNVFTVLHTFTGGKDGAVPQGGLLLDAAGNLYGTTSTGGKLKDSTLKNGTVYKISTDGTYTVLHRFAFADGQTPNGGLVSDPDGNLYGTAQTGGNGQDGTIFEVSPDGTFKVLYNFQGLEDGAFPLAGLFRDEAGHLYGTTFTDGDPALVQGGNVFEFTP
jgi:uncharacterized repeat protein (TIGR03803 family)